MSDKLYFEVKGEELLQDAGLTKAEFARRLGICKQNVNSMFATKNIIMLRKAADILGVPFELLISYTEEPDLDEIIMYSDIAPRCKYIRIIIPYYIGEDPISNVYVKDLDSKSIEPDVIRELAIYDNENKQFDITVGIEDGIICGWNYSSFLQIRAKVDRKETYILLDKDKEPIIQTDVYVPERLVPPFKHNYGNRITLLISKEGRILNWPDKPYFITFAKYGTVPQPIKTNKWYRAEKVIDYIKNQNLSTEEIEKIKNNI